MTTLTLIGKDGCHLCDIAEGIVEQVLAELPEDVSDRIDVEIESILEDKALYDQWWEKIPVLLINGEVHTYWRVGADRLHDALLTADKKEKR